MTNEEIGRCRLVRDDIVNRLGDTPIYLYGIGEVAERLLRYHGSELNVVGYIDNKVFGSEFNGKTIINGKEILEKKDENEKIVITTFFSSVEIADGLISAGMEPEKDFYIFDHFESLYLDDNLRRLVELNKKIFPVKRRNTDNSILVSFWKAGDATSIIYAYVSNYLADKYDADIKAYVRDGNRKKNIAQPVYDIYESFGTGEIFDVNLTDEQIIESERIFNEVMPTIHTMEDWHKITIYGVNIGASFVQTYSRFSKYISTDFDEITWTRYIKYGIRTSIFWHDYFENSNTECVVMIDHGNNDGFIRDYACARGIPVYAVHYNDGRKLCVGYSDKYSCSWYKNYKIFWDMLTEEEKERGIDYAKKELAKRLSGETAYGVPRSPYANKELERLLDENDKIKVVICPHIFDEETMSFGWQLFGDYITWLNHLAMLSEKTDYDWYIKIHPREGFRGRRLIREYCLKHTKIKLLPDNVSPVQLAKEGVRFALTIGGSLGHEYPLLGIQVINAGNNPHIAFNFNWNPKTKEEYDNLILNLENKKLQVDITEIYEFYCINFLYYKRMGSEFYKIFFRNNETIDFSSDKRTTKTVKLFLDSWTEEVDKEIRESVKNAFIEMDSFDENHFYRKDMD